jgi:ubiquinone/menaquinone biosynthesis C-methylase UbiE
MQPATKDILKAVVVIAAVGIVLRQCRKPAWWPGRFFLWIMNNSHAGVTAWGLKHAVIEKQYTVLDVGCGGGRTIETLAAIATEGKVYGIDYSPASVAASRRKNAQAIAAGRVDIRLGLVSSLPYPDGTFDLVTAVETHYYWPDVVADMREILRVLKPGGTFMVIAETYKGRRFDAPYLLGMKLLRATYLTAGEHSELLSKAGYSGVEVFEERNKGWLCAVGRKPA